MNEVTAPDGGQTKKKKRVKSTERHLVFKVLFLQVLHKRDHFVDDWIQHWLEEQQTLVWVTQ